MAKSKKEKNIKAKKKTYKNGPRTEEEGLKIDTYTHKDKTRLNNPPVGLVTPESDIDVGRKQYKYDPHLDPQLQWAGKTERLSFEVDTVSLHVHERIDPFTIIDKLKQNDYSGPIQTGFFDTPLQRQSIKNAIEFYKHKQNWTNRLIAGDSLLVMNSLLEKEGMSRKVQMIYFDPPYGIKYGSNFQAFTNKRDVKDGKDDDLNQEPEMLKAFRDTWELGIHSYITYIRDRLLLAKDLLAETGSIFVQISDENLHHVREILDEVFGNDNFVSIITVQKAPYATSSLLPVVADFLIWYGKNKKEIKYHSIFKSKTELDSLHLYRHALSPDGKQFRSLTKEEMESGNIKDGWRRYRLVSMISQGASKNSPPFVFEGKEYYAPPNSHWKIKPEGLINVAKAGRIQATPNSIQFRGLIDDFPISITHNIWTDTITGSFNEDKVYVVQTNPKIIERCLLMTSDPGDLVLDFTCGSGTTAYVSEQWGRRWITCDSSRVAITLAKQRLMTATFPFYKLAHEQEGVSSGFIYETVPHITLGSIANNEPPATETLYDKPLIDKNKIRVTGAFTIEAVPAPTVRSVEEASKYLSKEATGEIIRTGETLRQSEYKDELLRTGIRAKNNQRIYFSRVETLSGTKHLHAEAETRADKPQRVVISFGPEHNPLEQRQVALALDEAQKMIPKPKMVLFCAYHFDPEASKDIDEINFPGVQVHKVQMNTDLLTKDLKKKQSSSDSFFFIGSPDVIVHKHKEGTFTIEINGFDYYNVKTGSVESGGNDRIAMWLLDTDYDGQSLFPNQVFFPMAGSGEGWDRLSKNLKTILDEEKLEAFQGTISLPFKKGGYGRAAVKIVDDRGIESLKILDLD